MTLLTTPRSRIFTASAALIFFAALCFLFIHRMSDVEAAKGAIATGDPLVAAQLASEQPPQSGSTPVLVELFTSEGCSSCPPADALLARLSRTQPVAHADVIALEEHVDYWDSLGWKDRFSSHDLTVRQSSYARRLRLDDIYTPQMIIDGTNQFVGNDDAYALRAIAHAAQAPKLALALSQPSISDGRLTASASLAQPHASIPNADVFAALVEPSASTQVLKGENGGHTLQHVSVVRSLQRIGSLADLAAAPLKFSLNIPKDSSPSLRVVVFIQTANQGAILAAATSSPAATPPPSTSVAALH